jgi:hypothetical protein
MKKLYIFALLSMVLLAFAACDEEQEFGPVINTDTNPPELLTPTARYQKIIDAGDSLEVMTFVWTDVNFGVNTPISYSLYVDSAGRAFENAAVLGTTTETFLTLSVEQLNTFLLEDMGFPANESSQLELMVTASIADVEPLSSDPVPVSFAPFFQDDEPEVPAPNMLWVPGAYQEWDPASAPTIREISENVYEGYVYLNIPTGYKFTSHPNWDNINYGDAGEEGVLTTDGAAPSLGTDIAGYYRFIVNTEELTYSADLITSFGIIGTATPGQWDSSTEMTFDEENGVWTVTQDLVAGALKFRANDAWDINYGPADSNALEGFLIQTDGAISITESGNYTITIDMGTTESSYDYTYEVVRN